MRMRSPSLTRPIGPPSAASGTANVRATVERRPRTDVADAEAVRSAAKAPVGQARDVVTEPGAHDHRGRLRTSASASSRRAHLEHLRHARTALRPAVANDDDRLLALLDRARLDSSDQVGLVVKAARRALELEALLAGDLRDGTGRSVGPRAGPAHPPGASEPLRMLRGQSDHLERRTGCGPSP